MTTAPDFEIYADQKTFNETIAPGWQAAFEEAAQRIGRLASELRFLDVGCGDGKYFRHLVRQGLVPENIHGVEVSKKRVERCHAIGWVNARYVEDGVTLPHSDDSMNLINFMEVIEHVPSNMIDALLTEMSRVLAPEGLLLVSTPNYPAKRFYDHVDALLHGKWDRLKDDPTHVTFYNHSRLSRLLTRHFGSIEERTYKNGFLYTRLPRPALRHKIFYICTNSG